MMRFRTSMLAFATSLAMSSAGAQKPSAPDTERARIEAANGERERGDETARVAAGRPATPAQTRLLTNAIVQDSRSWLMNRYDVGSLTNVRASTIGGVTMLRGDYSYNGGTRGWLEARVAGGRIECIHYHDTGGCAPVRTANAADAAGPGPVRGSANPPQERPWRRVQQSRQISRCLRIVPYVRRYETPDGSLPASEWDIDYIHNECSTDQTVSYVCEVAGRTLPPVERVVYAGDRIEYMDYCQYTARQSRPSH